MAGIDKYTKLLLHLNDLTYKDEVSGVSKFSESGNAISVVTDGKFNNAVNFPGGTYLYYTGTKSDIEFQSNQPWTLDFWFYKIQDNSVNVVFHNGDIATYNYMLLQIPNNQVAIIVGGTDCRATATYTYNTWNHVALVNTGTNFIIFLNGIKIKEFGAIPLNYAASYPINLGGCSNYYTSHNFIGRLDEFRISSVARWTKDFTPPTSEYCRNILYVDTNGAAYGVDSSGTFTQIAGNFSNASLNDKLAYLRQGVNAATSRDLQAIGKFKVFTVDNYVNTETRVQAIPKGQLIKPKQFIKITAYDAINNVNFTNTVSGSGVIRLAVTKDLVNYQVFDAVSSSWVPIQDSQVATKGMTPADIAALTVTEWDALCDFNNDVGIAFAVYLDISSVSDAAEIDEVIFNVNKKGPWNKAIYGTDYTYSYHANDLLKVSLLTNGSYKINYAN